MEDTHGVEPDGHVAIFDDKVLILIIMEDTHGA